MARIKNNEDRKFQGNGAKVTSIGASKKTRPKNKNKKQQYKAPRGQGSGRK
jgi:hypothetical protein